MQVHVAKFQDMIDLLTPWAIRVAATLRIADRIAEGTCWLPELAQAVKAEPAALRRLLVFLETRGIFKQVQADRFQLTPLSEPLLEGSPFGMRTWLDLDAMGGRMDMALGGLLHSIRTGEAAYPQVHGQTMWQDTIDNAEFGRSYADLMATHAQWVTPELLKAYRFPETGTLVDIGGGSGALLSAVLKARTGLKGILLDLPEAAAAAQQRFEREGLAERVTVQAGSFFDVWPEPQGQALYMLSWVLHDWPDADALRILQRCAEALRTCQAGRLLITEHLIGEGAQRKIATAMDLRLLALCAGRERTPSEMEHLVVGAQLQVVERRVTARGIHILGCQFDGKC